MHDSKHSPNRVNVVDTTIWTKRKAHSQQSNIKHRNRVRTDESQKHLIYVPAIALRQLRVDRKDASIDSKSCYREAVIKLKAK